ncbi:nucleotidyltransferase domain-containing protein [Methylotenera sp. 1P/1]|uniref:nucleotidyltransferase domain-containing protein n=1 Tax=Methylotenera sp. 1P/1 TaxID=1131551 RepID=UPI00035E5EE1|nr:nucleotidyltransferase domain-containing protein [Methylotenera sp. 1P/1]
MSFTKILESHSPLNKRRQCSLEKLDIVKKLANEDDTLKDDSLSIFCAGSLARLETGEKSDLDVFVLATKEEKLESRLFEYTLFSRLISLNEQLKFPPFSNDGEYLKIHFLDELKNRTGSRRDDVENLFTVRMLLMLESKPLVNEVLYNQHLTSIIEHYYRDGKGKASFRPLFLLNDLLRYWRTLCLNYEERRHEPQRPWRKKNINLKFSRMLTVFGTVLPLVTWPVGKVEELVEFCNKTPIERLAAGLERLDDNQLLDEWESILDVYESFLTWKDESPLVY